MYLASMSTDRASCRWTLLALLACGSLLLAQPGGGPAGGAPGKPGGGPPAKTGDKPKPTEEPDTGDYFGNALGGLFGGAPWTPLTIGGAGAGLRGPRSMFQPGRRDRRFEVSGNGELSLNVGSVSGADATFSNDQYNRNQTISEQASLLLSGPIWKWANLNVHAQFDQRSFGFNDTKPVWRVFWEDTNHRVTLGDISPSLGQGNTFVQFNRRLKGLMAEGKLPGNVEYLLFGSFVQGSIRTETFAGNGTAGPYFLTYTPIVDSSAVVLLDGVVQQAGYGDTGDYTLNPSTGELNFNGAAIVTPANRIEVRYETLSTSGPKDLLVGSRISASPLSWMHLGASYMSQMASSSASTGPVERRVTDQITVPTPSTGPFTLRPRPILPASESVTVNGLLQTRDVDYQINYTTGELQFFQLLPEGTNIVVRFSVKEVIDLGSGNRSLLGLDTTVNLGDRLSLQMEFATSSGTPSTTSNPFSLNSGGGYDSGYGSYDGTSTGNYGGNYGNYGNYGNSGYGSTGNYGSYGTNFGGTNYNSSWRSRLSARQTTTDTQASSGSGGTAFRMMAGTRWGHFQASGEYKAISDNFARVDSTGFYQNERGWSLNSSYEPGGAFSLTASASSYVRPYDYTVTTSGTSVTTRTRVTSATQAATLSWRPGTRTQMQLVYNSQSNSGGGSGNSVSRVGANLQRSFGRMLQVTGGVDMTSSGSSGTLTGLTTTQSISTNAFTGRGGLSLSSPGGRLSSRVDYSLSNSTSSTTKNTASSIVGSLSWQALSRLSFQFSHQLSDSESTSLVGRPDDTATTRGYPRPLWARSRTTVAIDPLTGLPIGYSADATNKSQSTNLSMTVEPIKDVNLTASWSKSVTDTGRLAGSTSDSWQANLHWQASDAMGLGIGYNIQKMKYTDSGDRTNTGIINATFDWRLSQYLDMRADWQSMNTHNVITSTSTTDSSYGISPNSSYSSLGGDLRWQIRGSRYSTYASIRLDNSTGSTQAYSRLGFQTGWDMKLTQVLGLRMGYEFTNYANTGSDTGTTSGSYVSHLFNATLGARF